MMKIRGNRFKLTETKDERYGVEIAKWKFKTALIALITSVISIFATASVINLNINTDIPFTVNKALVKAQDLYYAGKYSEALSLYQEFAPESGIASLNLGYMYSKGLGCKSDFEMACQYYEQAYSLGVDEGLDNYLAINLLYPNSFEDTLEALRVGVKNNHISAMKYVAFLETDMIFVSVNDQVYEYATNFLQRSLSNQLEALGKKSVETSSVVEYVEKGKVPEDTDFKKYIYIQDITKSFISHYTTEVVKLNEQWTETVVAVYDIKKYDTYCVNSMSFEYVECLFSENYYKI